MLMAEASIQSFRYPNIPSWWRLINSLRSSTRTSKAFEAVLIWRGYESPEMAIVAENAVTKTTLCWLHSSIGHAFKPISLQKGHLFFFMLQAVGGLCHCVYGSKPRCFHRFYLRKGPRIPGYKTPRKETRTWCRFRKLCEEKCRPLEGVYIKAL